MRTAPSGVVTVTGGKLTTYRRMAADAVDAALDGLGERGRPSRTKHLRLFGGEGIGAAGRRARAERARAPHRPLRHRGRGGARASSPTIPTSAKPSCPACRTSRAEARYAVRHEMARTLDDVLSRRTRARLLARDASAAAADDVADLLAVDLGWSRATRRAGRRYRRRDATERRCDRRRDAA